MTLRWLMAVIFWGGLAGCAKQADLPDTLVTAASPGEFARFRAELGTRFPAEQLRDFDTATQELQLDAMNRDIRTAAEREQDMLAAANGKPVHAVVLLGWQARQARLLREIAEISRMLEHDQQQQAKTAAAGTPQTILTRIQSEKDVLAKLQHNLAETDRHLAELQSHTKKPGS